MKKLLKIISLILAVCCIATLFVACSEYEHKKIAEDYAKLHNLEASRVGFECYGEFGRTHVMIMQGAYPQVLTTQVVDDVVFHHPAAVTFTVYNNGSFCGLNEAYANGLLTHDDLIKLRDVYNPQYSE